MNRLFQKKKEYIPESYEHLKDDKMQWFRDAKFGMFIHWGLYAIPAKGEWEMFNHRIDVNDYAKYADTFTAKQFDAANWAQIAKDAGMRYMVLTARHHDGFCLFNSKVSDFNSVKTAAKRDFVKEYVEACRAAGLKVGIYYSPMDWRFPGYFFPEMYYDNAMKMREQCEAQLMELMSNYGKIDLLWFDGGWLAHGGTAWEPERNPEYSQEEIFLQTNYFWESERIVNRIRKLQPDIMINDRFGIEGDFDVRERFVGEIKTDKPWDSNDCLAKSWGWCPGMAMFTLRECIHNLVQTVVRDGNYLLNLGPMETGEFDPAQVERIRQVGAWLSEYGEAIYGTRGGPVLPGQWGGASYKDNKIYLHILEWPDDMLCVEIPTNMNMVRSRCLTGGNFSINQCKNIFNISVPIKERAPYDTIIELEMDTDISWKGISMKSEQKYGLRDGL